MATLTIRNLEDGLKARLRLRAAAAQRSMEEEARQILRAALQASAPPAGDLATRLRARFASLGGVELVVPGREPVRDPPAFAAASAATDRTPASAGPKRRAAKARRRTP
jgi:plasmid stability protein